jgi:hypothetical protein
LERFNEYIRAGFLEWHIGLLKRRMEKMEIKKEAQHLKAAEARSTCKECEEMSKVHLSYGPPWAHYLGGYQDRLLGGPLGLPDLRYTAPDGVEHKDYGGEVLG